MRGELYSRISGYIFAIYQWMTAGAPRILIPKSAGLLLDILEYQRTNIPYYNDLCTKHGRTCRGKSLLDYPAIPLDAFASSPYISTKTPPVLDFVWQTPGDGARQSGIPRPPLNKNIPNHHPWTDPTLLQKSLFLSFAALAIYHHTPGTRMISLIPPYTEANRGIENYLSAQIVTNTGAPGSDAFVHPDGTIDRTRLESALTEAANAQIPVNIIGNPQTYAQVSACRCANGSAAFVFGTAPDRPHLSSMLDIPPERICSIFAPPQGASQCYQICALNSAHPRQQHLGFIVPEWVHPVIYSEESGAPLLPGNVGLVALCDMCCLDTPAFYMTGRRGRLEPISPADADKIAGKPKWMLHLEDI